MIETKDKKIKELEAENYELKKNVKNSKKRT